MSQEVRKNDEFQVEKHMTHHKVSFVVGSPGLQQESAHFMVSLRCGFVKCCVTTGYEEKHRDIETLSLVKNDEL